MKKNYKLWMNAVRPFSLTASIIPVLLGGVIALEKGEAFHIGYLLLSLAAMVLLQAAANLINTGDDFINKIDTVESFGSTDVVVKKLLTPAQVSKVGIRLLIIACIIGLFLAYERGIIILYLEIIGAVGVYSYTRKPFEFKYNGFGAPLIFLLFGPLPVLGSYYVQRQEFSIQTIFLAIPIGLLTTAILHANDIRDIYHDKRAGIKTLSIMVGLENAKRFYYGFLVFSYVSIVLMTIYKAAPIWSLLVLITIPVAGKNIKSLQKADGRNECIAALDAQTAKLQAQFGLVLLLSILINFIF